MERSFATAGIVLLPDNAGSRRVALNLGARLECVARQRLQWKGAPRDAAVCSLLPDNLAA